MKALNLLLILVLLLSALVISGCKKEEETPRECQTSSQCKVPNKCFAPKCTAEGRCIVTPKDNCCGNRKCDPAGLENQCNCPTDCGNCSGYIQYNVTSGSRIQKKTTQYAIHTCENNDCRVGVDMTKVRNISIVDDLVVADAFKTEFLTTFNNPFNVEKDKIKIEFSLKDKESDISGPLKFTEIKVLSDTDEMMGRKFISEKLENVGNMFTIETGITSSQRSIELEKHLNFELFYELFRTVVNNSAPINNVTKKKPNMQVLKRSSIKVGIGQKFILVAQPSMELGDEEETQ